MTRQERRQLNELREKYIRKGGLPFRELERLLELESKTA